MLANSSDDVCAGQDLLGVIVALLLIVATIISFLPQVRRERDGTTCARSMLISTLSFDSIRFDSSALQATVTTILSRCERVVRTRDEYLLVRGVAERLPAAVRSLPLLPVAGTASRPMHNPPYPLRHRFVTTS